MDETRVQRSDGSSRLTEGWLIAGATLFVGVAGISPDEDIFSMPTITKVRMVTGVDARSDDNR